MLATELACALSLLSIPHLRAARDCRRVHRHLVILEAVLRTVVDVQKPPKLAW